MTTISLYRAAASALLIGVSATLALASGHGLLFPSLGPTAMGLVSSPETCEPRTVLMAHLGGVLAAVLANALLGSAPLVILSVAAPALATAATLLWQTALRCVHPPAVATTLLLSTGLSGAPHPIDVCIGVVLLSLLGEPIRRMFLRSTLNQVV